MMGFGAGGYGWGMGAPFWMLSFLPVLLIWGLFWKGLALWHSAKRGEVWWFVAVLLVNTLGLLEIVYLFLFAKLKLGELFGSASPKAPSSQQSA